MPKLQTRGYGYIHLHTKRWGECLIQQTSLEAYKAILPELSNKQQEVVDVIEHHPGMSNHDIARFLNWEINTVTPRVNELREKGVVDLHAIKVDRITEKKVMTWEVVK